MQVQHHLKTSFFKARSVPFVSALVCVPLYGHSNINWWSVPCLYSYIYNMNWRYPPLSIVHRHHALGSVLLGDVSDVGSWYHSLHRASGTVPLGGVSDQPPPLPHLHATGIALFGDVSDVGLEYRILHPSGNTKALLGDVSDQLPFLHHDCEDEADNWSWSNIGSSSPIPFLIFAIGGLVGACKEKGRIWKAQLPQISIGVLNVEISHSWPTWCLIWTSSVYIHLYDMIRYYPLGSPSFCAF